MFLFSLLAARVAAVAKARYSPYSASRIKKAKIGRKREQAGRMALADGRSEIFAQTFMVRSRATGH
jgi:hypothetical protein